MSNPQPRTTIYNTSRTSNIHQTLQTALSRRTQLAKSSHHQRNHSSCILDDLVDVITSLITKTFPSVKLHRRAATPGNENSLPLSTPMHMISSPACTCATCPYHPVPERNMRLPTSMLVVPLLHVYLYYMYSALIGGFFLAPRAVWLACVG